MQYRQSHLTSCLLLTIVVFALMLILLLQLFSRKPDMVDIAVLGSEHCSLPCWQGLEPGQTTEEELVFALSDSRSLGQWQRTDNDNEHRYSVEWRNPNWPNQNVLTVNRNILTEIVLLGPFATTAKDVLHTLGPPDIVGYNSGYPGDSSFAFYYSQLGSTFYFYGTASSIDRQTLELCMSDLAPIQYLVLTSLQLFHISTTPYHVEWVDFQFDCFTTIPQSIQ